MLPTVLSRARGWISACDKTVVCCLKRSTSERTNGRIAAEVTSTGASPSRAACSKRSRPAVMNWDGFGGCIPRLPPPPSDDRLGKGLLPFCRQRDQRKIAIHRCVLGADLARQSGANMLDHGRG